MLKVRHIFLLAAIASCGRREAAPEGPIRRIVTTTPSSTELVAAAGATGHLVGVDRFSVFPPEVKGLPIVGDFMAPSVDAILQLAPDLVVLDAVQAKTAEALADGGVRTLVLEMHRTEHVLSGLAQLGRVLGGDSAAAAEAARARLERAIAAARAASGARRGAAPRVLIIVDRELGALRSMVAAGPGTYLDELTALCGARNVMADAAAQYPKIAPETVLEIAPDVILDATHSDDPAAALRDWQAVPAVPAVKGGRVHMLVEPYYVSPGPRLDQALERLRAVL
ncbi:MAG TPA: helical backbone metal receptor [Kofleriaceae bacterium]|nr:helical backbone metal receptor [Kofleriaceae bacterium]